MPVVFEEVQCDNHIFSKAPEYYKLDFSHFANMADQFDQPESREQLEARINLTKRILDVQIDLYNSGFSHEKIIEIILNAVRDVYSVKCPDFDYSTLDEDVKKHLKELAPKFYSEVIQNKA